MGILLISKDNCLATYFTGGIDEHLYHKTVNSYVKKISSWFQAHYKTNLVFKLYFNLFFVVVLSKITL